ncbi:response regulator transcription factor [Streptomyces swartbergensis]|uniref:Helix-turn-helix transcriptional regulator n=1 Tax=Streptomyces swartbergensis TaxID=487165 RepID=A0A243R694_9ACTN|nr:response regulator transcription factor [Streptomyces swartbergensis]OUC90106.1 helix-turn-helix transcriptional regulator [Streptomyces swartbergensis]
MRTSRKLSVALACPEGSWPHPDWPAPDDPYVERVVSLRPPPPFRVPGGVDAVVLRCAEPVDALRELRADGVPVIVVGPHRDAETIVEVFRGGAGYLVEGDYCTCMLSSAVVGATIGHTYLSPAACAALREGARQKSTEDTALERLRGRLSPRERQIMELLSTGLGAQEIGLRLRLSEKTVRNNLSNIYAKLDARGSTDAVLRWLGAAPVLRI